MMKSHRKELWFHIPSRRGFVNITSWVEEAVRESAASNERRFFFIFINPTF